MSVKITVTACDNELFLIAGQNDKSYLLANIKSGNNQSVNYQLDVVEGQFGGTKNVGNPNYPIDEKSTTYIPAGSYNLIILGADWGGSDEHFDVKMTGGTGRFHVTLPKKHTAAPSGWAPSEIGEFTITES